MPVGAVGADRGGHGADGLGELVAPGGVPEADGAGVEVDLVGAVVPHAGLHGDVPLLLGVGHPPQGVVPAAAAARAEAVLQLGEVALEEGDLVLASGRGGVGVLALDREVVVQGARGDGAGVADLGDELGPAHGLAVPVGGVGQGDLGALGAGAVRRVGIAGVEGEIVAGGARAEDVPLVLAGLVRPRPVLQGGRGDVVEAAGPLSGPGGGEAGELGHEGQDDGLLHHLGRDVLGRSLRGRGRQEERQLVQSLTVVCVEVENEWMLLRRSLLGLQLTRAKRVNGKE